MHESETLLSSFGLDYLKNLCADLADEDLTTLTESTGKTPQWILGHLRIAGELGVQLLGGEPACGEDWFAAFGPGSAPGSDGAPQFTVAEVLEQIESAYGRLLSSAKSASSEQLNAPSPFEPLKEPFPTVGNLVSHLLATHFAYHLAQLSACRRGKGLPIIF